MHSLLKRKRRSNTMHAGKRVKGRHNVLLSLGVCTFDTVGLLRDQEWQWQNKIALCAMQRSHGTVLVPVGEQARTGTRRF